MYSPSIGIDKAPEFGTMPARNYSIAVVAEAEVERMTTPLVSLSTDAILRIVI
jgi:hypothetical protein